MLRLFTRDSTGIPSFTASNNLLVSDLRPVTRIEFTPIEPHPATYFDTIHKTIVLNFQNYSKKFSNMTLYGQMK